MKMRCKDDENATTKSKGRAQGWARDLAQVWQGPLCEDWQEGREGIS